MAVLPTTQPTAAELLAALNAPGNVKLPTQQLGQADFLRLLTTQLKNQDPTSPLDPKQMITDLTGFNQLEATLSLNKSMDVLVNGLASLQTMQAAGLIGKRVKVQAQQFNHQTGMTDSMTLTLDQPLRDVRVVIGDSSGVVREIRLGALNKGNKAISWDGKDVFGQAAPSGVYSVTAYGTDANGNVQTIATVLPARVISVAIQQGGGLKLSLATGEVVDMSKVREITQ